MIYLDNAATTQVLPDVINAVCEGMLYWGNPSSAYLWGRESKNIINQCRHQIELNVGAPTNSLVFTASGSESNSTAIKFGFMLGQRMGRNKILISSIEHKSVLQAAESLKEYGAIVKHIAVDRDGRIDTQDLCNNIDSNTAIVSVMTVNNEIGTIQDIESISKIAKSHGALFHTDAVQALPCNKNIFVSDADFISISGHKIGAPKGIGGLIVHPSIHSDLKGKGLINGGEQEFGLRAGTENTPYIMAFSKAVTILDEKRTCVEQDLKNYAIKTISKEFPYISFNGSLAPALSSPSILNFALHDVDGASVVDWMNFHNIYISSGSACNTGSKSPSHVLTSIGLNDRDARSSIRISFSERNSRKDIDEFICALKSFEKRYIPQK